MTHFDPTYHSTANLKIVLFDWVAETTLSIRIYNKYNLVLYLFFHLDHETLNMDIFNRITRRKN